LLAVIGAIGTQLLATRYLPLADRFVWDSWDDLVPFGAVGGALLGNLCWVALKASERVTGATFVCVVANVLVWIAFLVFNPPLTASEFAEISAHRAGQDSRSGYDIVTDVPIVVAGRWSGTWGALNAADYALHVFAGPAVLFAELLVVPPFYSGDYATKGESYVIAGVCFVLSTSFWAAFGGGISAFRREYRRRQAARSRMDPVRRSWPFTPR
jgi:hypothetical protein